PHHRDYRRTGNRSFISGFDEFFFFGVADHFLEGDERSFEAKLFSYLRGDVLIQRLIDRGHHAALEEQLNDVFRFDVELFRELFDGRAFDEPERAELGEYRFCFRLHHRTRAAHVARQVNVSSFFGPELAGSAFASASTLTGPAGILRNVCCARPRGGSACFGRYSTLCAKSSGCSAVRRSYSSSSGRWRWRRAWYGPHHPNRTRRPWRCRRAHAGGWF